MKKLLLVTIPFLLLLMTGCRESEEKVTDHSIEDFIIRKTTDHFYIAPPTKKALPQYPWRENQSRTFSRITKEFFRCKGTALNPERIIEKNGKPDKIGDCGGSERHSLPLRNNIEFIYPILINLLNHIQMQTGKRVIITSGHRCPEHNTYVDPAPSNNYSKHMIGAEVSFFIQGMEERPQEIVDILLAYYQIQSLFKEKPDFQAFQRYEKSDTNVSTKPWFNKEIFIKLYKSEEGRNFDNRHPFPYVSIQVRYDTDKNENVVYSWDEAYKNFLRK